MTKYINEFAMAAYVSMNDDNLRGLDRAGEGHEVTVTQEKKKKEGGGEEGKQEGEKIVKDGEDEDIEGSEGTMFNQPSTRDPKPADWESWSWERKREWWTPRNAARKARKVAVRQKQGEQGTAEKAAAEKTVSSERTQEKLHLHGSHSQNPQFLPSQQHQQGHLAGYTHSGRGELPGAAYQTLHIPPNPLSDRPLAWVSPTYMQASPSPYHTPQHKQDYKSCLGNTHALPARPATPLPKLTAGASSAVQSKYRKIEKARQKKFETFEQTVERVRGEERKKLEEERKSMEEEREKLECERKKMEEEWKKIGCERKKMDKERKKVEGERMEEDKEEM